MTNTTSQQAWQQVQNTRYKLGGAYAPIAQEKQKETNTEGWHFSLIVMGRAYPTYTADSVLAQVPYMKRERVEALLAEAVSNGHLEQTEKGYLVTEQGKTAVETIYTAIQNHLSQMGEIIPQADLQRLAELAQKLDDALANGDKPEDKSVINRARAQGIATDAPLLFQVTQLLSQPIAFRDDAHVAAWRSYVDDGYVWEAFSHVWGENVWGEAVHTADALAQKLGFRGYDASEYGQALDQLATKGWLNKEGDTYKLTDKGVSVRQEAEEKTDKLFYASWSALSPEELAELTQLCHNIEMALTEE